MPDNGSRKYGVRKRGGKWTARPYVNGEHHWLGTFEAEGEAEEAAREFIEESRRLPSSKETIRSFAKRWLTDYARPKESTNEHYRQCASQLVREYGDKRLRDFKRIDARRFTNEHRAAAIGCRVMFSDAIDEGLLEVNPFAGLKSIGKASGRKGIKVLTEPEVDLLLQVAGDAHPDYDFWQLVAVAFYTGMRPSEIYGLEWADVDYRNDELQVHRQIYRHRMTAPKNGRSRKIILPPRAKEALRTLAKYEPIRMADETGKTRPLDLIFRNKSSDPMSSTSQANYWSPVRTAFEAQLPAERREELRAARDSNRPHMDLYEGRHFCATYLLEKFRAAGEDGVSDVATQLGHTDDGTLVRSRYGHPSDDLARERLKKLFEEPTPLRPVQDEEAANG